MTGAGTPASIGQDRRIDDPTSRPATGSPTRGHRRPLATATALVTALAVVLAACSAGDGDDAHGTDDDRRDEATTTTPPQPQLAGRDDALPPVVPTPRAMAWVGPDLPVAGPARVVARPEVDEPTRRALEDLLTASGADVAVEDQGRAATAEGDGGDGGDGDGDGDGAREDVAGGAGPGLVVHVGALGDPDVTEVLDAARVEAPAAIAAEGYVLAAVSYGEGAPGRVAIAAHDPAGWFYGVQTLGQLVGPTGAIAGVQVTDAPAMGIRGAIEGFYGSPWTHDERLAQLRFYGSVKLNTYIYAPKDDPYHRDRWREPYPPAELDRLAQLIEAARAGHVRFTFAVSPGVSICFSGPADTAALVAKLQALYDLGVRSFSVAFDDITADRWNCPGDAAYGPPSLDAAGRAQATLLNQVRDEFVATHDGTQRLQMVPTDYRGVRDSGYRAALRQGLGPDVEVMWTGTYVVPPGISVADARTAGDTYGRPPLIWDNTPVNDFPATEGRLLLGPYVRREVGLSEVVGGLVLNPMNQAAASTVALTGAADFAWNDAAYDPARAHRVAATRLLTGTVEPGDVDAVLAFLDLENLAPTSATDGTLSQPQAPALAARLDTFRGAWASGDKAGAVEGLRAYALILRQAPATIRERADEAFAADVEPWLRALDAWSAALVASVDGLAARAEGDEATAAARFAEADGLVAQARAVHTIEGETRPQGPVRVGDGVLDAFLDEAKGLA